VIGFSPSARTQTGLGSWVLLKKIGCAWAPARVSPDGASGWRAIMAVGERRCANPLACRRPLYHANLVLRNLMMGLDLFAIKLQLRIGRVGVAGFLPEFYFLYPNAPISGKQLRLPAIGERRGRRPSRPWEHPSPRHTRRVAARFRSCISHVVNPLESSVGSNHGGRREKGKKA
jgi:hypothetical protein